MTPICKTVKKLIYKLKCFFHNFEVLVLVLQRADWYSRMKVPMHKFTLMKQLDVRHCTFHACAHTGLTRKHNVLC